MDAPALPFEIRASSNRGGTVRFTATRDGAAKAIVNYMLGNVKRRMETATVWAEDAALQNGRALTVEAVAAALLAKELEVADALHEADEAPEVEQTVDERNTDFPAGVKVGEGQKTQRGPSIADQLVELTDGLDLFHTTGADGDAYARVSVTRNGQSPMSRTLAKLDAKFNPEHVPSEPIAGPTHIETWPVNSKGFRRWLSRRYHEETERAPNNEAMQSALNVIAGQALFDGAEHAVHVRVAGADGRIYLDLCDADWRVVEITEGGWRVLPGDEAPVRFVRRRGMLPLPGPVPGGSIDKLRQFVNVGDDDGWRNLVGFILATFRPTGPYPVLCLAGEQGSGKSTVCRFVRSLIDPNAVALRRPPRDERDIFIAASNSHVIAWDNVSGMRNDMSDALCALATGGGFATRELYSDGGEAMFAGARPVVLNGICDVATRSDLLDRAVCVTLPTLAAGYDTEAKLEPAFEAARPGILGAFLDAVVAALGNIGTVTLDNPPRMADFAAWVTAAEPALPWASGAWLTSYTSNRNATHEAAIEANPVATAIVSYLRSEPSFGGTAAELLTAIEARAGEAVMNRKDWPRTARGLSGMVRRLAPNLRALGVDVEFQRGDDARRRRLIRLSRTVQPSKDLQPSNDRPKKNRPGATENAVLDGMDGLDGQMRLLSGPGGHGGIAIDALHTGALTGAVPTGWTLDGWVISLKDRLTRTDDPEMRKTIQGELDAMAGKTKDGDAHTNSEA